MNWRISWLPRPKTASDWFVGLRATPISRRVSDAFTRWLASSPENEVSYEEREVVWELASELRNRASIEEMIEEAERCVAGKVKRARSATGAVSGYRWRRPAMPLVALLAVLGIGIAIFMRLSRSVEFEYETRIGEQQVATLPDGTSVLLNTGTHLRGHFARSARVIEMDAGEALFTVAKNPERPFVIHAFNGYATAVGTQLVVRLRQQRAEVTVLEGLVNVSVNPSGGAANLALGAGRAVDYSADGHLSPVRPADMQRIEAWKAHRILFDDTTLADAIDEYNLYAAVPIVLKSALVRDRRIHGVFRIGDEQSFVHVLEQGLPLRAVNTGQTIELVDR